MATGFLRFRTSRVLARVQARVPAGCRRFALWTALALVVAGPAAGGPEHELRREVIAVIDAQIAAFRRDDGPAAFEVASPGVQDQYGTAEAYLVRIANAYKPVHRPKAVTYLNLAFSRGRLVQRVLLVGPDDRAVIALFPMVQMDDGRWRVDGCVLVPASGKRAESEPDPEVLFGPEEVAGTP